MTGPAELDPHWEWFDVTAVGDRAPRYIRGRCKHLELEPVRSVVTSDIVAQLCLACDTQFTMPWADAGALPRHG